MIASLKGVVTYKSPQLRKDSYFVIEAGGVGYKVYAPLSNLKKMSEGKTVTAYTYLAVSERAMDLYGFLDPADKTFFTLLLEVPGIGPKSALGILDKTTMAEVQRAILDNDPEVLTQLAGLSEKTAEKIIVALKSKVESLTARPRGGKQAPAERSADSEAFEALVSIGYSAIEARRALNQVDQKIADSSQRVKAALKLLAQK
ncbi:MAG: Holliday junction DNA helicase RuvA [Candidatus Buchananbacteria bacterium RIFCSPLOWO2_01_FULL_56_15]|uniref:Holliday junction branch migration complex subunit RuvA n=2 Tax=Candidatus Buchananiibacteriota TaxID=1817903 RepID=A0A1G1YFA2_9BACT|nr:MAG: Holliday junction DNA helicase RuvA [Candidatus Buchananbacteria bacterium RIFCSPHIGHO2_02_FULL_56_16]OGY54866.1 MAG: Holliday junction DNA helicase RuvA [Candidatus Buchananbacteria bacterium RIFCSPLOWO2_01_FULL_56_15]